MNKTAKLIAALTAAAKKQPDPVKRGRILDKIREVKQKQQKQAWLSQ